MPKNKFQEVIFTIIMVFVMVYAMICQKNAIGKFIAVVWSHVGMI